jgi:lipid II:glycine glycyltransferase (peptidoglycan interpeptide bridge formation enzyme)
VVQLAAPGCWSRIEQNLRRLVERARTNGLEFCEDEDFDAFYSLHAATLARHDVGAYLPRENFRRYFEGLRSRALASLFHVRAQDGRVAASLLVLLGGNNVSHSVSAASDPGFNRAGASVLLRWNVFQALAERGYAANDLTDASLDSVGHFKAQLGGALEMSLVLQSPRSARFRAVESLSSRAAHARAAAGRIVRGILPRKAR